MESPLEKGVAMHKRGEEVVSILETLTQEYFDNICVQLSANKTIYPMDLAIVRGTLGPITYINFVAYVESQGEYELRTD